jgi:predicted transcriptional regulator
MSEATTSQIDLVSLAAEIVSAYVSNNRVSVADVPALIGDVHRSLKNIGNGTNAPIAEPLVPAVPVKKSIQPDFIICLEDGKKFKSLKRHLRTKYDMTPAEYRTKWNLPHDYPMVAPNYAEKRSSLAKSMGLGRKAGTAQVDVTVAPLKVEEAPAAAQESPPSAAQESDPAKVARKPRKPRVAKEQAAA